MKGGPVSEIAPTMTGTYGSVTGQVHIIPDGTGTDIGTMFCPDTGFRGVNITEDNAAMPHGSVILCNTSPGETEMASYNYAADSGGNITAAYPFPESEPVQVTDTYAAAIAVIGYPVTGDHFDIRTALNEVIDTAAENCVYNGNANPVHGNHVIDETGTVFKNCKLSGNITVSASGVYVNYCEQLSGWINYTAAGSYLQNYVLRGSATLDVDAAMTANGAYIETVDLASGIPLTANNCAFGRLKATIEAAGGTVSDTDCIFGLSEDDARFMSATDSRLQKTSPLINAGKAGLGINADIRNRRVPCGPAPDIGAYESRKLMIPIGDTFAPGFQP